MNTLKNIGVAIVGAVVFALALRIGYQAERATMAARKAASQRM